MINRNQATEAFHAYVQNYDATDPMIRAKIDHTFRVAKIAQRVAQGVPCPELSDFAWFLGLLHDIGRFEQIRRFGTYDDNRSVDHAELGADILFRDGLIEGFQTKALPEDFRKTVETAIRLHNKLSLPEHFPDGCMDGTETLCRILRDADKLDIFRLISEIPLSERVGTSQSLFSHSPGMTPEVEECVRAHRCVPRTQLRTTMDLHVSFCCMAFELEYPVSRQIAIKQGYLRMLLDGKYDDEAYMSKDSGRNEMQLVQREIENAWGLHL